MTKSLTARVLLGAIIWIVLAIGAGGVAVYKVFSESAVRQFDNRLDEEMELLQAAVAFRPEDPASRMTSPAFQRIYSGNYWQAVQEEKVFLSRSLQGFSLPTSQENETRAQSDGPDGQRLRYVAQTITAPDGFQWELTVAANAALLQTEQQKIQRSLWLAACFMTLALTGAAFLLLRTALGQLRFLRVAVRSLGTETTTQDPKSFPIEIAPLVADLNAAFEKNTRLRERGEVQAANLAHALKTPAAVLQNEIARVASGIPMDVSIAKTAVEQISTTADRHLRANVLNQQDGITTDRIDAAFSLRNLISATARLFPDLRFKIDAPVHAAFLMPESAFQEILGNLVENAGKWAKSQVDVSLTVENTALVLTVDDDGPGIPEDEMQNVLRQYVRLDEEKPGTGLGLSIVATLVDQFGGDISLRTSEMGGLCAEIRLNERNLNPS